MKEGTIRISASTDDYDDNLRTFDVVVVKGKIESHVSFLGDTNKWREFGYELVRFPEHSLTKAVLQMGGISFWGGDFMLTAYCYDAGGHSALQVLIDNKQENPHRQKLEFSIPAEVASLNRLGHLLLNWQVENNSEIVWQAQTS
jgi:hypothetical protein